MKTAAASLVSALAVTLVGGCATPPTAVSEPATVGSKPVANTAASADTVLELGRALYAHDQAGWHATDRFLADTDEVAREGLGGYVVVPRADGQHDVSFFRGQGADREVFWAAVVKGKKVSDAGPLPAPRPFTEAERVRRTAVDTAVAEFKPGSDTMCAGHTPLNTAVVDAPGGEEFYVYLLTPMTAMDQAVFGRHHRFHVSADGRDMLGNRTFTNSCAIFPTRPPEGGGKTVGIVTSHLLDPSPQETHVMVSLQHDQDVYVMTGDTLWSVSGRRIRKVK